MTPPPAELFASRIFLGPALRAQPDGRLVGLVREGYDSAFEEIVRRYRRPLERFAAAIVGGRSEDVTQDAFSKALLALRGSEAEIELRPWLYRIVRNTALNDLRDRGPVAEQLSETLAGAASAAAAVEAREELADLVKRLGALPEPQRAAIVMRELEGLSHEEIAAALGVSGGAARQAIHRARTALRDGLGLLVPVPVLRALIDHADDAVGGGAIAAGAGASSAGGAIGGLGAAGALKVGAATLLVAGTVGAGVAIEHHRGATEPETAIAAPLERGSLEQPAAPAADPAGGHRSKAGRKDPGSGDHHTSAGSGRGGSDASGPGGSLSSGEGTSGGSSGSGHSGGGSGDHHGGSSAGGSDDHGGLQTARSDDGSGDDRSGSGSSGGSGSDDGGVSGSGDGVSGGTADDGGTSGSSGEGSGGETVTTVEPVEESSGISGSGSDSSGDGSGDLSSSDTTSGSDGSP